MSESVGKQLGNFFGQFLEYDHKNNTSIWREYMRVKICLDVRRPFKHKKKITRKIGSELIATCKYERLGDLCFSCGLLTHTECFWRRFLDKRGDVVSKEWEVGYEHRHAGWPDNPKASGYGMREMLIGRIGWEG